MLIPLIGLAVMAQRAGDAAGGVFGVPRFDPRAHAFLKIGDNLLSDAGVNVLAFGCVVHFVAPFPAFEKLHFLVLESGFQSRTGCHRAERKRSSSPDP